MSRTKRGINHTGQRPQIAARLPVPIMAGIDAICSRRGISRAELTREILTAYVRRHGGKSTTEEV